MKSEAAFIPDNISAISNVSRHQIIPNPSHEFTQMQSDSTDNLVEEILRQRAERLKRQQNPTEFAAFVEKTYIEPSVKQQTQFQLISEEKSQQKIEPQETKQLNSSKEEFQFAEKLMNHSKGTINQSSLKEKQSMNKIQVEDHLEVLNNQTNQFSLNQIEENGEKDQVDNTHNKFSLPKIDKMSNESAEHEKHENSEKSLQLNLSLSPSQKKQDGIENHESTHKQDFIQVKSVHDKSKQQFSEHKLDNSIPKEEMTKQKIIEFQQKSKVKQQASSNNSNHLMHQEIGNGQSQIEVKNSQMQSDHVNNSHDKKGFYDFTPIAQKNQTDFQLVKAITQHLNTIQNQEVSQKTFRKSEKYVVPQAEPKKQPEPKQQDQDQYNKQAHFQEFETDYSENNRQVKILEHRWESNLQFEIGQLKEMIALYEALIINQECKQARKDIKQLQLSNRRQKISLRSASYTKRFNFHSPIQKNNDKPIQFRTKFVISERLKDQYQQTKQNIADQKKKHINLQQEYQVLGDYYDMMKQKKITVYQQTLKQYEYNSKIQKYETVKNSFFKKPSMHSLKQTPDKAISQYQFNKTKRTIEIQNSNVPYYQVLKYKIDISKDMILQFEVWNLSKLKKLRDENILIKKQIQYVDQLIHQIDAQFAKIFGIKTVKSLSKSRFSSPNTVRLTNASPIKQLTKSPIRQLKRQNIGSSPSQKVSFNVSSSNGFQNNTPIKKTLLKKENEDSKGQLLLINSVQLDYSKRKAMRILDQIDDYGMCPIKQQSKVIEDIPTFGKNQHRRLLTSPNQALSRSKSKNLVKPRSKQIKTMTNLDKINKSHKNIGKMSEQASPTKSQQAQSQYYISLDDMSSKAK